MHYVGFQPERTRVGRSPKNTVSVQFTCLAFGCDTTFLLMEQTNDVNPAPRTIKALNSGASPHANAASLPVGVPVGPPGQETAVHPLQLPGCVVCSGNSRHDPMSV